MKTQLLSIVGTWVTASCSWGLARGASQQQSNTIASPDGRVVVEFSLDSAGVPRYVVRLDGRPALQESRLGLVRDDADFSRGLRLQSRSRIETVEDRYEMLTAKRRSNSYRANRRVFHMEAASGQPMNIEFQVSNDGVAFRYVLPNVSSPARRLLEEVTSFRFLPETRAWLQPMQVARTGWGGSNPWRPSKGWSSQRSNR